MRERTAAHLHINSWVFGKDRRKKTSYGEPQRKPIKIYVSGHGEKEVFRSAKKAAEFVGTDIDWFRDLGIDTGDINGFKVRVELC